MKKLILGLFIVCIYNVSNATYNRTTSNGGSNGYNRTSDVRIGNDRYISCVNPGYEKCPKIMPQNEGENDPNLNNANLLLEYAINEIQNNHLTGEYTSDGLTVNWNSDGPEMYNSEISIK